MVSNESMANYYTDTPSEIAELLAYSEKLEKNIDSLQSQIAELKSELEEEKKVVDFYADPKNSGYENKDFDEGDDAELMYYNIVIDPKNGSEDAVLARRGDHEYEDYMLGKLARQRQRERK